MIQAGLPQPPDHSKNDLRTLKMLAAVHYKFGRYKSAMSILDLALWIYPIDPGLLQMQAIVTLRRGQPERAARTVDQIEAMGLPLSEQLLIVRRRASAAMQREEDSFMVPPAV